VFKLVHGVLAAREGSRVSGDKLLLNTLITQLDVTKCNSHFLHFCLYATFAVTALRTKKYRQLFFILHLGKNICIISTIAA